jgi:hypothetical protein
LFNSSNIAALYSGVVRLISIFPSVVVVDVSFDVVVCFGFIGSDLEWLFICFGLIGSGLEWLIICFGLIGSG